MALEFPYTCPTIDKVIGLIREELDYYFGDHENLGAAKLDIAERIEEIRRTNEAMRKQADQQISDLERERDEAQEELADARTRISSLEDDVSSLEAELKDVANSTGAIA